MSSTRQQSTAQLPARPSSPVDADHCGLSTDVDNDLTLLRRCISECGYTFDALEVEMKDAGWKGGDKSVISKVLSNQRPMTKEFEKALPDDVEALYAQRKAEGFGLIVVAPLTGLDAQRAFVAGALGLMASPLPSRAGVTAKAEIRPAREQAVGE